MADVMSRDDFRIYLKRKLHDSMAFPSDETFDNLYRHVEKGKDPRVVADSYNLGWMELSNRESERRRQGPRMVSVTRGSWGKPSF